MNRKNVYFPPGTYVVSRRITFPSNLRISGDKRGVSTIKAIEPYQDVRIATDDKTTGNLMIEDMFWSFQGARDKKSQVNLGNATFERMKAIGANVKFTEVANIGHGVGSIAFSYNGDSKENTGITKYASDRCEKTPDIWDWLFGQKRTGK
jgi:hypothetical protein